jgi:hypothetical protein
MPMMVVGIHVLTAAHASKTSTEHRCGNVARMERSGMRGARRPRKPLTFGVDAMAKDQLGPAGSAGASSDSGSDECRRGLMPATLMRCVKSQ